MLKNYSKIESNKSGTKHYLNDEAKPHRLDGPAIEISNGAKFWSINGIDHRNIDPCFEWSTGEKRWRLKHKSHRIGGSISSLFDYWYIHGKVYFKKEYFNIVWDI